MTKQIRIYLTPKAETKELLKLWADQEGRSVANLANWIIEERVREAVKSGTIKLDK